MSVAWHVLFDCQHPKHKSRHTLTQTLLSLLHMYRLAHEYWASSFTSLTSNAIQSSFCFYVSTSMRFLVWDVGETVSTTSIEHLFAFRWLTDWMKELSIQILVRLIIKGFTRQSILMSYIWNGDIIRISFHNKLLPLVSGGWKSPLQSTCRRSA